MEASSVPAAHGPWRRRGTHRGVGAHRRGVPRHRRQARWRCPVALLAALGIAAWLFPVLRPVLGAAALVASASLLDLRAIVHDRARQHELLRACWYTSIAASVGSFAAVDTLRPSLTVIVTAALVGLTSLLAIRRSRGHASSLVVGAAAGVLSAAAAALVWDTDTLARLWPVPAAALGATAAALATTRLDRVLLDSRGAIPADVRAGAILARHALFGAAVGALVAGRPVWALAFGAVLAIELGRGPLARVGERRRWRLFTIVAGASAGLLFARTVIPAVSYPTVELFLGLEEGSMRFLPTGARLAAALGLLIVVAVAWGRNPARAFRLTGWLLLIGAVGMVGSALAANAAWAYVAVALATVAFGSLALLAIVAVRVARASGPPSTANTRESRAAGMYDFALVAAVVVSAVAVALASDPALGGGHRLFGMPSYAPEALVSAAVVWAAWRLLPVLQGRVDLARGSAAAAPVREESAVPSPPAWWFGALTCLGACVIAPLESQLSAVFAEHTDRPGLGSSVGLLLIAMPLAFGFRWPRLVRGNPRLAGLVVAWGTAAGAAMWATGHILGGWAWWVGIYGGLAVLETFTTLSMFTAVWAITRKTGVAVKVVAAILAARVVSTLPAVYGAGALIALGSGWLVLESLMFVAFLLVVTLAFGRPSAAVSGRQQPSAATEGARPASADELRLLSGLLEAEPLRTRYGWDRLPGGPVGRSPSREPRSTPLRLGVLPDGSVLFWLAGTGEVVAVRAGEDAEVLGTILDEELAMALLAGTEHLDQARLHVRHAARLGALHTSVRQWPSGASKSHTLLFPIVTDPSLPNSRARIEHHLASVRRLVDTEASTVRAAIQVGPVTWVVVGTPAASRFEIAVSRRTADALPQTWSLTPPHQVALDWFESIVRAAARNEQAAVLAHAWRPGPTPNHAPTEGENSHV